MSEYNPPIENLPSFNNEVFVNPSGTLTVEEADARYLKYPVAQGDETISKTLTITGTLSATGTIGLTGPTTLGSSTNDVSLAGDTTLGAGASFTSDTNAGVVSLHRVKYTGFQEYSGITANPPISMSGHIIYCSNSTTLTLPDIASNNGIIYYITFKGSALLQSQTGQTIYPNNTTNIPLSANSTVEIGSNGGKWYIFGGNVNNSTSTSSDNNWSGTNTFASTVYLNSTTNIKNPKYTGYVGISTDSTLTLTQTGYLVVITSSNIASNLNLTLPNITTGGASITTGINFTISNLSGTATSNVTLLTGTASVIFPSGSTSYTIYRGQQINIIANDTSWHLTTDPTYMYSKTNTWSGNNTFSSGTFPNITPNIYLRSINSYAVVNGSSVITYYPNKTFSDVSGNVTIIPTTLGTVYPLVSPFYQYYYVNSPSATPAVITLPALTTEMRDIEISFLRYITNSAATTINASGTDTIISFNGLTSNNASYTWATVNSRLSFKVTTVGGFLYWRITLVI